MVCHAQRYRSAIPDRHANYALSFPSKSLCPPLHLLTMLVVLLIVAPPPAHCSPRLQWLTSPGPIGHGNSGSSALEVILITGRFHTATKFTITTTRRHDLLASVLLNDEGIVAFFYALSQRLQFLDT
ncbi:hypothetical protein Hypma_009810 [Hypsizygus marmoreus]|uniref:Uncharacterized protein n=1 Tax=Hypsizygus marmoreus TaxID=39966 RepID=A0A369JR81_HYPMA|nr:hypothetical protein Hypma_009810 [Hypsizygus marmoreus]